jgi:hypothetical protein
MAGVRPRTHQSAARCPPNRTADRILKAFGECGARWFWWSLPAGRGPRQRDRQLIRSLRLCRAGTSMNAGHLIGPTASPMLPRKKARKPPFGGLVASCCNFGRFWSGRRGSNPRPRPWQGRALPLSYTRIRVWRRSRADNGRAMPNAAPECNSPCDAARRPELQ